MTINNFCAYFTRHLRSDLRDRMRTLAAARSQGGKRVSMEDVMNEALAVGLEIMEAKRRVVILDGRADVQG